LSPASREVGRKNKQPLNASLYKVKRKNPGFKGKGGSTLLNKKNGWKRSYGGKTTKMKRTIVGPERRTLTRGRGVKKDGAVGEKTNSVGQDVREGRGREKRETEKLEEESHQ